MGQCPVGKDDAGVKPGTLTHCPVTTRVCVWRGASGTTESPHQASAKRPLQKLQREMLATGPLGSETGRKGKKEPHAP